MSIRNNKKGVFSTIGSYSTIGGDWNVSQDNDTLSSLNEDKRPLSFLIDVLKVTVGAEAIKKLVGELLVNITDAVEVELKKQLINQLTDYNSDNILPIKFINDDDYIEIPIKDIDLFSKLKTDPNSDVGSLLYGKNTEKTFDKTAYDSIITEEYETYNNIKIKYNEINESFIFKPNIVNPEITIGEWVSDFINQTTLIDKDVFISNVLNSIFGGVTSNENKSVEKIFEELKVNEFLKKQVKDSLDESVSTEDVILDDEDDFNENGGFLDNDVLNEVYSTAKDIKNGVVRYNFGCEYIFSGIKTENLVNLIDIISTSRNPLQITNLLEKEVIENSEVLTQDDDGNLNEEDLDLLGDNKEAVLDNFMDNCVNAINFELIKYITLTPQIITIVSLSNAFKNDSIHKQTSPEEYIRKNRKFIKCIIKNITNEINKFIFNLVVVSLKRLIKPIIKIIIKEKVVSYINILRSLLGK